VSSAARTRLLSSTDTSTPTDGYLWSVAKDDPKLRLVPRMAERDTVMY
jgi:hypothetical protein